MDASVSEEYAASICTVKIHGVKDGLDGQETSLSETLVSPYTTRRYQNLEDNLNAGIPLQVRRYHNLEDNLNAGIPLQDQMI